MARIGVQMMMLKEQVEQLGPFEVLRRLHEIGFRSVEVSQIPMTEHNVAEMARAREELGIEFAALSAVVGVAPGPSNDSLSEKFDKVVADAKTLGTDKIRIGMMPFAAMQSPKALAEFCVEADELAGRLEADGISLYYHNHHIEFARVGDDLMLDTIRAAAPRMRLEIDVHWVQRGGKDPVRTLQKYAGAVDLVHLKDYRIAAVPESAFEALAAGNAAGFMAAFTGPEVVQFGEVGEGNLDWPQIIEAAQEAGAQHLLIEQDVQYGRDPFEALSISHRNLTELGFGDLF